MEGWHDARSGRDEVTTLTVQPVCHTSLGNWDANSGVTRDDFPSYFNNRFGGFSKSEEKRVCVGGGGGVPLFKFLTGTKITNVWFLDYQ